MSKTDKKSKENSVNTGFLSIEKSLKVFAELGSGKSIYVNFTPTFAISMVPVFGVDGDIDNDRPGRIRYSLKGVNGGFGEISPDDLISNLEKIRQMYPLISKWAELNQVEKSKARTKLSQELGF